MVLNEWCWIEWCCWMGHLLMKLKKNIFFQCLYFQFLEILFVIFPSWFAFWVLFLYFSDHVNIWILESLSECSKFVDSAIWKVLPCVILIMNGTSSGCHSLPLEPQVCCRWGHRWVFVGLFVFALSQSSLYAWNHFYLNFLRYYLIWGLFCLEDSTYSDHTLKVWGCSSCFSQRTGNRAQSFNFLLSELKTMSP